MKVITKIPQKLANSEELESLKETNEILKIPGIIESLRKSEEQIKNGEFIYLSDLK